MYLKAYQSVAEAWHNIAAYLDFYNEERLHQALGYVPRAESLRKSTRLRSFGAGEKPFRTSLLEVKEHLMNTHERSFKVVRDGEGRQFIVMGAKSMYKATAEDTGGAYSFAIETTPPHSGLPLHVHHREDEAMYILEGEYEIQCGDRTIRASKGTFVFLPRDVANRFENVTEAPGSYIYITSPGGFETFMDQMSKATAGDPVDMSKVPEIFRNHGIEMK